MQVRRAFHVQETARNSFTSHFIRRYCRKVTAAKAAPDDRSTKGDLSHTLRGPLFLPPTSRHFHAHFLSGDRYSTSLFIAHPWRHDARPPLGSLSAEAAPLVTGSGPVGSESPNGSLDAGARHYYCILSPGPCRAVPCRAVLQHRRDSNARHSTTTFIAAHARITMLYYTVSVHPSSNIVTPTTSRVAGLVSVLAAMARVPPSKRIVRWDQPSAFLSPTNSDVHTHFERVGSNDAVAH